ncbi:MAG: restriction endonuclease subunit S, partial [Candidatus Magasanikbacteria bacterium]|nr:restriction endonuclease subunit S [Candidatus Magasanikbacteria bacterium]
MKNWEKKKLGELSKKKNAVVSGPFGSNLKVSDYKSEGIPILRLQNIGKGFFIDKDIKFINEAKAEELKYHSFLSGDIALAKLGIPIGKTCIIPSHLKSGIITADIVRIRPDKNVVDYNFLEYFLNSDLSVNQLTKNISGATRPRVNLSDVRDIEIYLPSLTEQQRIVAILDEAFIAIAKAKANAEKNLKNAKELFESYLQNVFEAKGEGWEVKTLGEVCNVIGGGTPSKANSKFYEGDIYWATVRDMKSEIIFDTEHKITKDAVKNSSTNIIPKGNVIIATRVGLGKVCLIENDTAINQDLRGVIPINPKKLSVDFLYRWFKSISHKIVKEGTGATVQGVKLPFIKSLVIYVPPIKNQQTIVHKLDALSAETKKLEAIYQQK